MSCGWAAEGCNAALPQVPGVQQYILQGKQQQSFQQPSLVFQTCL
jgi:hypothetical protein